MIDPNQLAHEAITMLAPLLPLASGAAGKLAEHAGEEFLSKPGVKLFDWLVGQFKGKPAETSLERAQAEPESRHRQEALRLEILEMAEKDTAFREQLAQLVKSGAQGNAVTQTANTSGDNNKLSQAAGTDINVQIS